MAQFLVAIRRNEAVNGDEGVIDIGYHHTVDI